jgi:uncharacterized protein YodC (DUF2158 family)
MDEAPWRKHMADKIEAGSTVRLKSGGPLMTVDSINGDEAWCEWFDDKKQPQARSFKLHVLALDDGMPNIG